MLFLSDVYIGSFILRLETLGFGLNQQRLYCIVCIHSSTILWIVSFGKVGQGWSVIPWGNGIVVVV